MGALDATPLRDADAIGWWEALDERARHEIEDAARSSLSGRDLLLPGGGLAGELAMMLEARANPSFVGIGSVAAQPGALRLYGTGDGQRAVVVEEVERVGLHSFSTCRPAEAAGLFAGWATTLPAGEAVGPSRGLELVHPDEHAPEHAMLVVRPIGEGRLVAGEATFSTPGSPVELRPASRDDVLARAEALLCRFARV